MSTSDAGPRRSRRRAAWAAGATVGVAGVIALTWTLALAFQSPDQIAARATPPPAAAVTAVVERGDLIDERRFTGVTAHARETTRLLTPPADSERAVITDVRVRAGEVVPVGTHVVSVNDRPVFLVQAPYDFFRDLHPGDSGDDVRALQATLQRLGLVPQVDGVYGPDTARGVDALFARAGASAPRRMTGFDSADGPGDPAPADPSAARAPSTAETESYLPLSSVVTTDADSSVIRSVPAVGDLVGSTSGVTLAGVEVVVDATLPAGVALADVIGDEVDVQVAGRDSFRASIEAGAGQPTAGTDEGDGGSASDLAAEESDAGAVVMRPIGPEGLDLEPGLPATITLPGTVLAENALLVPRSAVSEGTGGAAWILLDDGDGEYTETRVRILASLAGRIAIASDDDRVIEGARVRIA